MNMIRITSTQFLSVLVALLVVFILQPEIQPSALPVVQGFVATQSPTIQQQHSCAVTTNRVFQKNDSINGIIRTPRRCGATTTLNAVVGISSVSDTTTLWLSQLPQFPQLPAPPTPISIDPTTVLSDVFSTVLGTPLILAIPIVAALLVATLIAYLIVSYASPAEEE